MLWGLYIFEYLLRKCQQISVSLVKKMGKNNGITLKKKLKLFKWTKMPK